jgi:hypothetical protein
MDCCNFGKFEFQELQNWLKKSFLHRSFSICLDKASSIAYSGPNLFINILNFSNLKNCSKFFLYFSPFSTDLRTLISDFSIYGFVVILEILDFKKLKIYSKIHFYLDFTFFYQWTKFFLLKSLKN